MSKLKELRISKQMTQKECAKILSIPLRTYVRYENDEEKTNSIKYNYLYEKLSSYGRIDESHGILDVEQIKNICNKIFNKYDIRYCYLFGSYAKNKATEESDVDLFISMPLDGLKFYELIEELRIRLHKKIDLLDESQLNNNPELAKEILRDGVKIYGV